MGHLVFKVDDRCGVDGYSEVAAFEVEVWSGATACVASESYGVAGFDVLVGFHEEAAEVSVDCFEAVFVAHHYVVAVAASFIFRESDFSGECCADGVANLELEVSSVVHASEANVEAKIRQQLQILRDKGFVEFLGKGCYKKIV